MKILDNNIRVKLIKELLHIKRVISSCNNEAQKSKTLVWYYTYLKKHIKEIRYYELEEYLSNIERYI